ncbi:MAG: hypothetical protein AAGC60_20895 [Acidobacteriota bacterium]
MKQRLSLPAILLLVGILGVVPASATAGDSGASSWSRTETPRFTILSQPGGEVGRRLGADLERLHHAIVALTGNTSLASPLPTYFYIFSDEELLAPYRQPGSAERDAAADSTTAMKVIGGTPNAGYLVPHEHGNYAVVVGNDDFVPTRYVYKQYVHHLLHEDYRDIPHWLLQGVAEYFSAFKTEGDFALLGLPSEDHLRWIQDRSAVLMPMAELVGLDQRQITQKPMAIQRSYFKQSWALFHYLLYRQPESREQVSRFIQRLSAGVSSAEAFEEVYGLDLTAVGSELEAYLNKGTLTYLKVPVKELHQVALETVDLEPHEIEYHLGDLAAHAVEEGASRAGDHFRRALELKPDFGPARAGLGYLASMADEHEAALQHYEKAAGLAPNDFLSVFLYGKSLLRSLEGRRPSNDSERELLDNAILALSRSVELNDGAGQAWVAMSYAYGLHAEVPDAGVEALQRALGFYPEQSDLALNLLLAHARRGERAEADAVMKRLESSATDSMVLGRAAEILLQMDYGEAVRKARNGQTNEAITLFARIQSETHDPALKETVEQQLEKLSNVKGLRDFFDLYDQAAAAINTGKLSKAQELVGRLSERARQPWQRKQVDKLRHILELAGEGASNGGGS